MSAETDRASSPWVSGGTLFAGVLMLVNGLFGMIAGIAGIGEDDVFGQVGDYAFKLDVNAWGWIHLVLGIVVALTGCGILTGNVWARIAGVVLAVLVVMANFLWLPYVPLWALISIAIGVFVIWALCSGLAADSGQEAA
ncbi:DUF7144 family membrane protein [Streptomyces boncukensis]|nr:hypothetical protein [Streptomyces boncukensis]